MFGLFRKKPTNIFKIKKDKELEITIGEEELLHAQQILRTFSVAKAKARHTKEQMAFPDKKNIDDFINTINKLYDEIKILKKYEIALENLATQTQRNLESIRASLGDISNRLTRDERILIQYMKTIQHTINQTLDETLALLKYDFEQILNEEKEPNKCAPKNNQESIKIKKQLLKLEEQLTDIKENLIKINKIEKEINNALNAPKL